jgi:putative ABC transport system permease protein
MAADETLRGDVELLSGVAPANGHEVAIDATSAEEHQIALGSTIKVLFQGPTEEFTVVGTVGFGGEKDLGGTTSAYFDSRTAQEHLGTPGFFDTIDVSGQEGVSQSELAERLAAVVPPGAEAVTGAEVAQENSEAIAQNLRLVAFLFMVFAGVALFVGAFIIWNTFTMIVTQRSREIALLRAIGATRRQVLRSLVLEAVMLGAAASAVGIGLGVVVAQGLRVLMDVTGFSLPSTSVQLEPRTIWVSLLVGTLVTVVAALVPARRATQVLPVEALRDSTPGSEKPSRRRTLIGIGLCAAGVAGMLSALYGGVDMRVLGLGVVAALVGVLVALPSTVRPLASVIATPLRLRGIPGELAQQNAVRNPRRTSSTAAALMIGLTLVVSMGVVASSLKASFGDVLSDRLSADLYVTTSGPQSPGFSPSVIGAVSAAPGVAKVSASGLGTARFDDATSTFSSVDPATAEQMMKLNTSQGSVTGLGQDGVLVAKSAATKNGWKLGDTITAEFAASGEHRLRIVGVYDKGWIQDNFILSLAEQNAFAGPQLVEMGLVRIAAGADKSAVQGAISTALADHPDAQVLDQKGFEELSKGFLNTMLTFVTVMLLLAVLIALLGIVNTLALSVYERTRELGLLRAVGMTRAQVRSMVRWESVVISLIGAVAGAALGIGIGLAGARAMADFGVKTFVVPVDQVALYVVLAAVAGVLAAVGPARSAAKVDVLKAVVTD